MEKIVIFGLGKVFKDYLCDLNIDNVVCFADNKARLSMSLYGRPIIRPERIKEFDYDFIVLFVKQDISSIYNQLRSLGIPDNKIMNWSYYLYVYTKKASKFSHDCFEPLNKCITELDIDTVLDVHSGLAMNGLYIGYQNIFDKVKFCDDYIPNNLCLKRNCYRRDVDALDSDIHYDAAVCLDFFLFHEVNEMEDIILKLRKHVRYFILTIPYECPQEFSEWNKINFAKYGIVRQLNYSLVKFIVIDMIMNKSDNNYAIYTVTHKIFQCPPNTLYVPIYAGKSNDNEMGILGDGTGESISYLNSVLNECTALYWIWKNSSKQVVGLNHYHRYFMTGSFWNDPTNNMLDITYIEKYLQEYDLIVAESYDTFPYTLKEHIRMSVNVMVFDNYYSKIRMQIAKKYPDYLNDFDIYFNGYCTNKCHMFVTRKEVLDKYCEWFFAVILEVAQDILNKEYDSLSQRTVGYIAERLLTLWILHNKLKVKELKVLEF